MTSGLRTCALAVFLIACRSGTTPTPPATGGSPSNADGGSFGSGGEGQSMGGDAPSQSGGAAGAATGGSGGESPPPFAGAGYFDGVSRLNDLPEVPCEVTVTQEVLSPTMATVGVISFATNLQDLAEAEIHFGLDTSYGLVAPVDPNAPGYRTLLLGMRQNSTYHYRIAVSDGQSVCHAADRNIQTGALDTVVGDVADLTEAWTSADAAPGFIVTSRDGDAVIYDKSGEIVWAHPMWNVFSVRMSWDGGYMLGRDPGPFDAADGGIFYRVGMDGGGAVTLDAPGGDHHDFTPIPEGIAYLAKQSEGDCDSVYEASIDLVDGVPVFDTWSVYEYFPDEGAGISTEICHANRLHYLLEKDAYTVSDRNKDAIAVFSSSGAPLLSVGKAPTDELVFHVLAEGAGPGGSWHVQHGHHLYADDKLVVFSNDAKGGAALLHYTLSGGTARLDWAYDGAGASEVQGDAQRLPNGNFLVTANQSGTIVELAPDGSTVVGRYVQGGASGPLYRFGYSEHRASLYGTPPQR